MSNRIRDIPILIALLCIFFFASFSKAEILSKEEFMYCGTRQFIFADYSSEQKKARELKKGLVVYTVINNQSDVDYLLQLEKETKEKGYLFALVDFDEYPNYFDEGYNLLLPYFENGQWILYNKTQYDRLNKYKVIPVQIQSNC